MDPPPSQHFNMLLYQKFKARRAVVTHTVIAVKGLRVRQKQCRYCSETKESISPFTAITVSVTALFAR